MTVGEARKIDQQNQADDVAIKPPTRYYWNQIFVALLKSWPGLADRTLRSGNENVRAVARRAQHRTSAARELCTGRDGRGRRDRISCHGIGIPMPNREEEYTSTSRVTHSTSRKRSQLIIRARDETLSIPPMRPCRAKILRPNTELAEFARNDSRRLLQTLWLFLSVGRIDGIGILHRCLRRRTLDVMRWRVIEELWQVMCAHISECLKA